MNFQLHSRSAVKISFGTSRVFIILNIQRSKYLIFYELSEIRTQLSPSALNGSPGKDIVRRRLTVTCSQQGFAGSDMYFRIGSSRPISPLSYRMPKATDKTVFVAE
jgi:hypothetical protein